MKKIFLTGALTLGLLLVGCGNDVAEIKDEPIDFHANIQAKAEAKGIGTELVAEESVNPVNQVTDQKIDWRNAPHFDNFDALVEYLNDCKYNLQTTVPVVCEGFVPDNKKIPDTRPIQWLQYTIYGSDGQDTYILYEITNYPGERVAWAYTHDDTSFLSDEERRLYDLGVQIVDEAKNFSSDELYRELYLHDAITSRAEYHTKNPQPKLARFQSALGALLDGRANCQGYSDAFYMLATMCGLKADKVCGFGNGETHTWNTISFGNESYFVDVTWDDGKCVFDGMPYNNYIYFNAPTTLFGTDHRWNKAHVPKNLQKSFDGRNFYHTQAYETSDGQYFGAWATSAEDALQHVAYRIARKGYAISWIEAPFSTTYGNANKAAKYLIKVLQSDYGWRGSVDTIAVRRGKYVYFTVKAMPN